MHPVALCLLFLVGVFRPPRRSPSLRQAGKARAARHPASPPPEGQLQTERGAMRTRHVSLLLLLGRGQSAAALQSFQSTTQLLAGERHKVTIIDIRVRALSISELLEAV